MQISYRQVLLGKINSCEVSIDGFHNQAEPYKYSWGELQEKSQKSTQKESEAPKPEEPYKISELQNICSAKEWLKERKEWFEKDADKGAKVVKMFTGPKWELLARNTVLPEEMERLGEQVEVFGKHPFDREFCRKEKLGDRFPALHEKAQGIAERKTLFVLPRYLSEQDYKLAENFLQYNVDYYIFHPLQALPSELSFGFFFLDDNKKEKNAKRCDDALIGRLMGKLINFDGEDISKKLFRPGPVLLEGPTGTGKSVFARRLHTHPDSPYRNSKFIHENMSALPKEMMESRIKGCVAGYGTGVIEREGWLESADGGILFLDEFQQADDWMQAMLLTYLNATDDDVWVSRLGSGDDETRYRVKIILAVNEDVDDLIKDRRLRPDLFHRIRHRENFPPLNDILENRKDHTKYLERLIRVYRWKFASNTQRRGQHKKIKVQSLFAEPTEELLDSLYHCQWSGNFRELEKYIADVCARADDEGEQSLSCQKMIAPPVITKINQPNCDDREMVREVIPSKIELIERALKSTGFVLRNTLNILSSKEIVSSPDTLRRYIVDNQDRFSDEIRNNPDFQKIIVRNSKPGLS